MTQVDYEEIRSAMLTLMQQCKLTLSILLARLQLCAAHTKNVYLIGSRLWGTVRTLLAQLLQTSAFVMQATHSSDWDFMIVYSAGKWHGKSTIHNGDIDASIMDENEFAQRLRVCIYNRQNCYCAKLPAMGEIIVQDDTL
jgi:hypothetical protein